MVYVAYKIILYTYIYNYYLPQYPLKKSLFFRKYDFGILAVWRVISLIKVC